LALRVVPDQIEQLLANLLENAVRYTPAQASIEITLARGENDSAMIVVRDEGCGIEPGLRERVFDQFVTSEARNGGSHGSGLGLTIARSIVENHGGTISVSSSPGQGAVFTINLPLARRR